MNRSIRIDTPIEIINITSINPLISKCQIKVCWVGDEPNRNRSIITKDVARQMANSLPGSPIVGFFNESKKDFEEHNRQIEISNGKFVIKDNTRPYGFVDLNAKVWFAKYEDYDGVVREYLVTEGYLWTKQYPECQRIIEEDRGNNQSMELDEENLNAFWTKDDKGKPKFFIINEAIISKLCVLGDDNEPCFQGSNITAPTIQFSFEDGFKEQLFSMMNEIKNLLNKEGEKKVFTRYNVTIGDALWDALYSHVETSYENHAIESVCKEEEQLFAILTLDNKYYRLNFSISETEEYSFEAELTEVENYEVSEDAQFSAEAIAEYAKAKKEKIEDKTDKEDTSKNDSNPEEEKCSKCGKLLSECVCGKEEEKKHKYSLEEIPEYVELTKQYLALETSFNALKSLKEDLEKQIAPLAAFKENADREAKKQMIASFYMLTDEDKKDVTENIDSYSIDEIEAKLSIMCVRNKVSFSSLEDNKNNNDHPTTYTLNNGNLEDEDDPAMPAWVKAAMKVAKTMN